MSWHIVKAEQLPFGKRILQRGCRGGDVKELQQRLTAAGFYYGAPDGCYGVLTEEAVCLLQRTFKLRQDGKAGPAVVAALAPHTAKTGRIIYTVKPGETLTQISGRFGVLPAAWRRIPGNRPGVRRLYPGQRLLLYQKALLVWEHEAPASQDSLTVPVTGLITKVAPKEVTGKNAPENFSCGSRYYLWDLAESAGAKGQLALECCVQLLRQLHKLPGGKIGFDLRKLPAQTLFFRERWLKKCLRAVGWEQVPFVLLPLTITPRGVRQLFWAQLDWISRYTRVIMIEPEWQESSADDLQASFRQWEKALPRLARLGSSKPLVLVLSTHAWSWDENQAVRQVPLAEVRRIRALYSQGTVVTLPEQWALVNYLSQGKPQVLLYREHGWWEKLLQQVVKYNFTGLALQDFDALGEAGPKLIAATFSVLPEDWL